MSEHMSTVDKPDHPPVRRGRLALRLTIALVVLAGAAWVVHWRLAQASSDAASGGGRGGRFRSNGPMPVATAKAERGDIDIVRDALGTVTSLDAVTVRTQISGQLVEVLFQEGQMVKAGDLLARVDQRPYDLSLAQSRGQLVRDQALLDGALHDLERYRTLAKEDSIAGQQLDTQQTLVNQYQGAIAIDQAQIGTAELQITYCHVTAPVSGRAGLRQVDAGNYISPADANGIVVITQLKPISVVFSLPEDDLPTIQKRMASGAKLPVTAFDRAGVTKLGTGTLTTIDGLIDTTTGSVRFRSQFDNDDGALFPNQFVNAKVLVDTQRGAVVLPISAVQRGAPGTFVFVVKEDSTVTVRPVTLGAGAGERVAIDSGLEVGETVVVDGGDKLRDGAQVVVRSEASGQGHQHGGGGGGGAGGDGEHHHRHGPQGQTDQAGGQNGQPPPSAPQPPASAPQPAGSGDHPQQAPAPDGTKPQWHPRPKEQ
jgi:multidrug efflux system membrane fusion protein